jgi:hypothetical protein
VVFSDDKKQGQTYDLRLNKLAKKFTILFYSEKIRKLLIKFFGGSKDGFTSRT